MKGIVDVRPTSPNTAFKIFISNYSSGIYRLTKNHTAANLFPQTVELTPTKINLFEGLGVHTASTEEEQNYTN